MANVNVGTIRLMKTLCRCPLVIQSLPNTCNYQIINTFSMIVLVGDSLQITKLVLLSLLQCVWAPYLIQCFLLGRYWPAKGSLGSFLAAAAAHTAWAELLQSALQDRAVMLCEHRGVLTGTVSPLYFE